MNSLDAWFLCNQLGEVSAAPCFARPTFLIFLWLDHCNIISISTVYLVNIWMHGPSVISSVRSVRRRALRVPTFLIFSRLDHCNIISISTVYLVNIWMQGYSIISSVRSVRRRALHVPTFLIFSRLDHCNIISIVQCI